MSFRAVVIESPARLSVRNGQLVIKTEAERTLSPEDITALLLENRQSTVTAAALSLLGENGVAVFVCDEKHLPCAVLTPYLQHSRATAVLRDQMEAGEPLKKRLWQAVVRSKIANQAACLEYAGNEAAAEKLRSMLPRVASGDTGNVEASAAQLYFPALFGEGFSRGQENGQNAALNYGYAIVRGCVARNVSACGLLPALGLHHRSTLNAFNLADDLLEPFRPVIDLLVYRSMEPEDTLTPDRKRLLFNVLNLDIFSGGQHHSVNFAVQKLVQSLARSFAEKKPALLLPELTELKQHAYE